MIQVLSARSVSWTSNRLAIADFLQRLVHTLSFSADGGGEWAFRSLGASDSAFIIKGKHDSVHIIQRRETICSESDEVQRARISED